MVQSIIKLIPFPPSPNHSETKNLKPLPKTVIYRHVYGLSVYALSEAIFKFRITHV